MAIFGEPTVHVSENRPVVVNIWQYGDVTTETELRRWDSKVSTGKIRPLVSDVFIPAGFRDVDAFTGNV
jgi:hypothetical protein